MKTFLKWSCIIPGAIFWLAVGLYCFPKVFLGGAFLVFAAMGTLSEKRTKR